MSYIKNPQEVKLIIEGGEKIGKILEKLGKMAKPGVSAWEIDQEAEKMIRKIGGVPAFKGYHSKNEPPFPSTICASINDELVHGIATKEKILKNGDIFSIDIGMEWPKATSSKSKVQSSKSRGYFTDTAITVIVGNVPKKVKELLWVTQEALEVGIEQCKIGNTVADIGRAIEDYVKSKGDYGIVRDLVGHGVGHEVHEEPRVPNYYDKNGENWVLQEGAVIAIEPMVTMGDYRVKTAADGWGISTVDGSLCAHFEHTICITKKGAIVATRRPNELMS
jgi:methionyl aminopeptidase